MAPSKNYVATPPTKLLSVAALLALLCVTFAAPSAGEAASSGEVARVFIYLPSPTNPRNVLSLEIFPAEGVAVASTYYGGRSEAGSGASYAVAIPVVAPFDGSLDLDFPGLGEVAGKVTPTETRGPAAETRLCGQREPSESATFEGRIAFHGAGDPRRWSTTRVEASIVPSCGARLERRNGPSSLFHHFYGFGPTFLGDFIRLFANGETMTRRTQFAAVGDSRGEKLLQLLAFDEEWLPGEIATLRWVKHYASFKKVMHFAQDDNEPSRVTVTPPAPFSGRGTYLRRTGRMTGSLEVHFPGLEVRLARPPAEAIFEDEERP